MDNSFSAEQVRALVLEWEKEVQDLQGQLDREKQNSSRNFQYSRVLAAYIKDLGQDEEDAKAAWRNKGYGL